MIAAPAHVVDRPALRRQLDEALAHSLTLLVAPAGAGKSVLLAQWAAAHPELSWVWLDVEPADDDPARFSQRFLQGLAAIDPGCRELAGLVSMNGGGLGAPLLEALGAQMVDLPESVIVLDDLHHLSNVTLLSDLASMVGLLPPHVHLVLSTRVDLPIAWSRRRLRYDMTEIRQADLALGDAESALLLERITGRTLGSDSVSALVQRTEGWAAGLQLAAMTLRHQLDAEEFVTQFSGNDRLVADYLSEEVLQAQSQERRQLLLHLSVLDELSAELVTHLTGEPGAQLILEELERESMFLVPLDNRRERFRFHHLFRDLLRYRLRAEHPHREARLLRRAAEWHLGRDDVGSAVEYLLAAEDWGAVLDLILARGSEVFERGEMATVARWINEVPEAYRGGRNEITLLYAFLLGTEGQTVAAEDDLRRVATDPRATVGERACAQTFRSALVQSRADPHSSVEIAAEALDLLGRVGDAPIPVVMRLSDPSSLEAMALGSGGRAHFLAGHMGEAREWLERGLAAPGSAYSVWRISVLGSLALLEAWCGRTERADSLALEALAIARPVGMLSHTSTADAYLSIALTALERGEPRRAALPLHEATVRAAANRRTQLTWIAQFALALRQASEGLVDDATATVQAAQANLATPPAPVVADRLTALRCRLLRLGGEPELASSTSGTASSPMPFLAFEQAAAALTLARPDLARKVMGDAPPPDATLEPLAAVQHRILQSWLCDVEGSVDESRAHLVDALEVGGPHSLADVFLRAGPVVVQRISALDTDAPLRADILQRARELNTPMPGAELVDPLTDRELEILSYLPSRYTNSELAERCYVSVNTIKTHMAHIYRKLDVPNRNAAIVKAREIGLV